MGWMGSASTADSEADDKISDDLDDDHPTHLIPFLKKLPIWVLGFGFWVLK